MFKKKHHNNSDNILDLKNLQNENNIYTSEEELINKDLSSIRNKDRQFFTDNQPENFSIIFHDYSDDNKGFVVWKDQLEESLI